MEEKEDYKRFTISLPKSLFKEFETFRKSIELSRSESIRKAMKTFMLSEEKILKFSENVVGCIAMIITHEHFNVNHEHLYEHSILETSSLTEQEGNEMPDEHHHDHHYTTGSIYADVIQTDLIKNNDIQHHYTDIIISTMHVHIAFDKCLEILAVQGPIERIKKLKISLQKLKSVISVDYFLTDHKIK